MTADTFCTGYIARHEGALTTCGETMPLRVSLNADRTLTLQGGKGHEHWAGTINPARTTWELGNRSLGMFGGKVEWNADKKRYELTGDATFIPTYLRISDDEVLPQERQP